MRGVRYGNETDIEQSVAHILLRLMHGDAHLSLVLLESILWNQPSHMMQFNMHM